MFVHEHVPEPVRDTRTRTSPPIPLPRIAVFTLAIMFSLGIAAAYLAVSAQETRTTLPLLTGSTSHTLEGGTVVVSGTNFSPGGEILIAIQDVWGVTSLETRWTTASEHTLATTRSHDPSLGFHPGGTVHETFGLLCGQTVTVRALDAQTGNLSNPLDLDVDCGG